VAYPSRDDLVAASTVTELTEAEPTKADEYLSLAIQGVEHFTGQSFQSWAGTQLLDGQGGDTLYLPRRLERLDALLVDGQDFDLTSVQLSPDGARLALARPVGSYAVRAMRDGFPYEHWNDTRTFRSGVGAVSVTGLWGWSTVPPAVTTALLWDMEDQARADTSALAGTVAAYRRLGVTEIVQGNLRATLGGSVPMLSPRATSLLGELIWRGPAGYLV
jgi:hypothetical protein